jgi:hypothetical protein
MAKSEAAPPRFNSGDAIQIGTGMGLVLLMSGARLIDAVIVGVTIFLAVLGVVATIRRLKN